MAAQLFDPAAADAKLDCSQPTRMHGRRVDQTESKDPSYMVPPDLTKGNRASPRASRVEEFKRKERAGQAHCGRRGGPETCQAQQRAPRARAAAGENGEAGGQERVLERRRTRQEGTTRLRTARPRQQPGRPAARRWRDLAEQMPAASRSASRAAAPTGKPKRTSQRAPIKRRKKARESWTTTILYLS